MGIHVEHVGTIHFFGIAFSDLEASNRKSNLVKCIVPKMYDAQPSFHFLSLLRRRIAGQLGETTTFLLQDYFHWTSIGALGLPYVPWQPPKSKSSSLISLIPWEVIAVVLEEKRPVGGENGFILFWVVSLNKNPRLRSRNDVDGC